MKSSAIIAASEPSAAISKKRGSKHEIKQIKTISHLPSQPKQQLERPPFLAPRFHRCIKPPRIMAHLHHGGSRPRRRRHAPFLLAISILAITTFPQPSNLVSAQNAGKFASRSKLVENASKKKRNKKVDNEEGEYTTLWGSFVNSLEGWGSYVFYENGMNWLGSFSWSATVPESSDFGSKKKNRDKRGTNQQVVLETSWRRDLFAAEFHLIIMSIMSSGLIAVLAWFWFRTGDRPEPVKQICGGEKGGECILFMCLPSFSPVLWICYYIMMLPSNQTSLLLTSFD